MINQKKKKKRREEFYSCMRRYREWEDPGYPLAPYHTDKNKKEKNKNKIQTKANHEKQNAITADATNLPPPLAV